MDAVFENVTIKNEGDVEDALRGVIGEECVRQANVRASVNPAVGVLIIGESLRRSLGLRVILEVSGSDLALAQDDVDKCALTEPVEIHCLDGSAVVQALVVDGREDVVLGAVPIAGMGLSIDADGSRLVRSASPEKKQRRVGVR